MVKVFFATVGYRNKWEIDVIRELQPKHLLVSYFYFRGNPLEKFVEDIGYLPNIMLDSGAYSAWTQKKNISVIDYMMYVRANQSVLSSYICLDVIPDGQLVTDGGISYAYYRIMRDTGFSPMPCFHYGNHVSELERYLYDGNESVALGATVPVSNKNTVAAWVQNLLVSYPGVKFHLLGSSSKKITSVEGLYSCDASSWVTMAVMGNPKHIKGKSREAKIERARFNMELLMSENNG